MGRTYTVNLVHCVFSTKERKPLIVAPAKLWKYVRGIGRNTGVNVIAVGGTANHVHLLLAVPPTCTVAKLMQDLKTGSSRHLNEQERGFGWQDGYAAISVSPSQLQRMVAYIDHQVEHHQARTFEEEYVAILDRSGVAYDPLHLLD